MANGVLDRINANFTPSLWLDGVGLKSGGALLVWSRAFKDNDDVT